jgi:F0F1-type ATP synthase delta subunit
MPGKTIAEKRLQIVGVLCNYPLTKAQERKVVHMFQPYSLDHKLWYKFEKEVEKSGGYSIDHEFQSPVISFSAENAIETLKIAEKIQSLLT